MTTKPRKRSKQQAAKVPDPLSSSSLHFCAVQVKQIDRFYDFQHFQEFGELIPRYAVIDGVPQIVYGKWGELSRKYVEAESSYRAEYGWKFFSATGGAKNGPGTPYEVEPSDEEILQVEVSLPDSKPLFGVARTFRREDSRDVTQFTGWLYVFEEWLNPTSGAPIDGRTRLIRELQVERPLVRDVPQMDLVAAEQAWVKGGFEPGPDVKARKPSGGSDKPLLLSLPVEWLGPEGRGPTRHSLYLSPFQLPWEAIELVKESLPTSATQVGDPFFTDVIEKTGGKPEPLVPKPTAGGKQAPADNGLRSGVTYVVHVVNPLAEANVRANELASALEQLFDALPERAQEEKWRFAKRVELFTVKSADLRAIVEEELNAFLYPRGLDTIRLLVEIAKLRARDLVAWVGCLERPSSPLWGAVRNKADRWSAIIGDPRPLPYLDAPLPEPARKRRVYYEESFGSGPPPRPSSPIPPQYASGRNLYCDLMARYSLYVSDDTLRERIINEANVVLRNLADTPNGQAWLNHSIQEMMHKTEEELDRRLRWDQEEKLRVKRKKFDPRKPEVPYGAIDFVLAKHSLYAKSFTKVPALLPAVYAFGLAKVFEETKKFGRLPLTRGTLAASLVYDRTKTALAGMDALRSAIELASNLRDIIDGSDDPMTYLKATGNFASAWDSASKAYKGFTGNLLTPGRLVKKIADPGKISNLSVYANVVTVVCCLDALFNKPAHDDGETVGRAIELAGAGLCLAAALIASGEIVVIAVLNAVGALLQWLGKELAFELSDSAQFLHACEFGKPAKGVLANLTRFPQHVPALKYTPLLDSAYDRFAAGKTINRYKEMSQDRAQWTITRQNAELMKLMYEFRVRLLRRVQIDIEVIKPRGGGAGPTMQHHKARTRLLLVVAPWYWNCYCEGWVFRIQGTIATATAGKVQHIDASYGVENLRAQSDRIKTQDGREPREESLQLGKLACIKKELWLLALELNGGDYDGYACNERLSLDLTTTSTIQTALDGKPVVTEVVMKRTMPLVIQPDMIMDPANDFEKPLRRGELSKYQ